MGSGSSSTKYPTIVLKQAEKHEIGKEACYTIYQRFNLVSNGSDYISEKNLLQLFPFCTELTKKNLMNFFKIEEKGVTFENFIPIFRALRPEITNQDMANLVYLLFEEENKGWSIRHFIAEIRACLLFSSLDDQKAIENIIRSEQSITHLTRAQFMEKAPSVNSDLMKYAKQLIFGSFLFQ